MDFSGFLAHFCGLLMDFVGFKWICEDVGGFLKDFASLFRGPWRIFYGFLLIWVDFN